MKKSRTSVVDRFGLVVGAVAFVGILVGSPVSAEEDPAPCKPARQWCEKLRKDDPQAYFLCLDFSNGKRIVDHFYLYPKGLERGAGLLLPNRRLVVAAQYGGQPNLQVDIPEEQIGAEEPVIAPAKAGPLEKAIPAPPAPFGEQAQCTQSRVYSVPSLRSGTSSVTVKVDDVERIKLPLVVEKVYAGSARFGVAAIFGPAVSHQYRVVTAPGSMQREIGLSSSGSAEFELVVGASAFVWDLLSATRGRTFITPRPWWSIVLPSPFVGIGAVGTLGDKVTAFQSLHLGGEWEFARSVSLSVTAVLRRTTRLNQGLVVGSPVSETEIVNSTHSELNWGLGLVVNFSPDLLQIATPTIGSP
jgi:hypothetical protein